MTSAVAARSKVNTLDAVRLYLSFLAGARRRAQVETLAGWLDIDDWRGYGSDRSEYVQFYYDPDGQAIRERASNRLLEGIFPDGKAVFGVWPVRFVERASQ